MLTAASAHRALCGRHPKRPHCIQAPAADSMAASATCLRQESSGIGPPARCAIVLCPLQRHPAAGPHRRRMRPEMGGGGGTGRWPTLQRASAGARRPPCSPPPTSPCCAAAMPSNKGSKWLTAGFNHKGVVAELMAATLLIYIGGGRWGHQPPPGACASPPLPRALSVALLAKLPAASGA